MLAVADKVASGLNNIMDATNGDARLPYHDTFVGAGMGGNELRPGLPGHSARREPLRWIRRVLSVKNDKLLYAASPGATPAPFRVADYVLLRIDGSASRDDYRHLASIASPYNDFLAALDKLDLDAAVTAERNLEDGNLSMRRPGAFRPATRVGCHLKGDRRSQELLRHGRQGCPGHTLDEVMSAWAVPMAEVESLAVFQCFQP